MYEELINELRDYAAARKGEIAELTGKAADAIEELSKPRWIPVTERLPEANKPVLVVSVGKLGQFVSVDWVNAFGETRWAYSVTVTHWMPLPEPPKEET